METTTTEFDRAIRALRAAGAPITEARLVGATRGARPAGVSAVMVYRYRKGKAVPGADVATALAAYLRRENAALQRDRRPYRSAEVTTERLFGARS